MLWGWELNSIRYYSICRVFSLFFILSRTHILLSKFNRLTILFHRSFLRCFIARSTLLHSKEKILRIFLTWRNSVLFYSFFCMLCWFFVCDNLYLFIDTFICYSLRDTYGKHTSCKYWCNASRFCHAITCYYQNENEII